MSTTSTTTEELLGPIGGDETAAPPVHGEIRARGYWEQVWRRFKRDRVAMASIVFLVLLIIAAYPGAWIAGEAARARAERHLPERARRTDFCRSGR